MAFIMDILEEIVARKRVDLQQMKAQLTERTIHQEVELLMQQGIAVQSMSNALKGSPTGIIAEFKRRSPSKGWIKENADSAQIPLGYQQAGASALSILTDTPYFGGDDSDILKARNSGVTLPILYKNFVIDEYQLVQARLCGASAVLLIAACLSIDTCARLLAKAHDLGLEVLLEMHDERDLDYAALEPDMCGCTNRNLGTFVTDVHNSFAMAARLPAQAVKVSESGIGSPATVRRLRAAGYDGFLVGEQLMKQSNPGQALQQFIDAL